MKTRVYLLLLFISIFGATFAQESTSSGEKKVWYGVKFGLDATTETKNFEDLTNQLQGNYQAGIFVQFGKRLYIQPELYYASYKVESSDESTEATTTSKNFVKAPLLVGLKLIDIGLVAAHIDAGTTYTKQLTSGSTGTFKWTLGVGAYVLGFITADIRYQFQNKINSQEVEDLINNGGTVSLTVGIRL